MLIAEDLYQGYHVGFPCTDTSAPPGATVFLCKVILLLLCGDIPAIAKATGFIHQGDSHCQWCNQSSPYNTATNRHYSAGFRRWLPPNSLGRAAGGNFPDAEENMPPPMRTHKEVVRQGLLSRDYFGPKIHHPKKQSGIKSWCPLSVVPYYDMVKDVTGDFMHLNMWYPGHMLPAMRGTSVIGKPRLLKLVLKRKNPLTEQEVQERREINDERTQQHAHATQVRTLHL
jgi:hypothetical protein